jgi:hypothetical protein
MASIRYLIVLVLLILAAGLLVGCVPIPPYDPVLTQRGVSVQQEGAALPAPTATAAASLTGVELTSTPGALTQVEPTSTPPADAQVEPTITPAESVPVEPTSTPVTLAQAEATSTPVTVTITLANPSDAQVLVALTPADAPVPTPTSMPTASFTATPAPTFTPRPTSTVAATLTRAPTMTRAATSTRAATATPAPTPTATVDQHLIIITEEDIAKAVAGGAGAQQGVTLDNLKVRFAGGKTHITADKLGYGFINMQNLDLVGSLAAQNGVLSLAVESISPRGLAANFVPGAVNQALANFASQWYVEEVRTFDGRVELRVR